MPSPIFVLVVNLDELDNTIIGDSGAAAVGEALNGYTALATLRLNNSTLLEIVVQLRLQSVEKLQHCTYRAALRQQQHWRQHGAAAIGEALKANTALATLTLGSNSIGAKSVSKRLQRR